MTKMMISNSEYEIKKAKVTKIMTLTPQEKLFEITLADNHNLDHEPGQFVEVSILGAGEAPISLASSPTQLKSFELVVRAVGRLSEAMHKLNVGSQIGIRGPFGKGFPIKILEGNDLLIVAGGIGIVPLRSLIKYIIDNRRDFGKVTILLGCKTPQNILFGQEITEWEKRMDINFSCTVDRADPEWKGSVGFIHSLIPGIDINPLTTFAMVVGPPVMFKYVIQELLAKNMTERQIWDC